MERNRRPPDVEEALSSMLWTPYQRTPTESSDDDTSPMPPRRHRPPQTAADDLYPATDRHMYPKPIRYGFVPNYFQFLPKSYNSRQLPSYENIEKERGYQSFPAGGPGIYLVPSYSKYSSSMVHSFTDDFIHYQVNFVQT